MKRPTFFIERFNATIGTHLDGAKLNLSDVLLRSDWNTATYIVADEMILVDALRIITNPVALVRANALVKVTAGFSHDRINTELGLSKLSQGLGGRQLRPVLDRMNEIIDEALLHSEDTARVDAAEKNLLMYARVPSLFNKDNFFAHELLRVNILQEAKSSGEDVNAPEGLNLAIFPARAKENADRRKVFLVQGGGVDYRRWEPRPMREAMILPLTVREVR